MSEDRRRILRWMGVFSLPWAVLGLLLWFVTRPGPAEQPIPGTGAVVEGVLTDTEERRHSLLGPFTKSGAAVSVRYDDGMEEVFREAAVGAERIGFEDWDPQTDPEPRVRLRVCEEKNCENRVFTRIEILPGS